MSTPDIQFFSTSGTWVKPSLAVRVDIVLKGGEAGAVPVLGVNVGAPGELLAQSYAASDLPGRLEVEVGKGGRPGGRDGYALIVTHLVEGDSDASPPAPSAWDKVARDVSVMTAGHRDGADVLAEVRERFKGEAR